MRRSLALSPAVSNRRPLAASLALLLGLGFAVPSEAATPLRGYDDDFEDGILAVLQAIDPDDGMVSVPAEYAGCPSGANPPNTVFSAGFVSGLAQVGDTLHGLKWSDTDVFLFTLPGTFCATASDVGPAPVGFRNLESLAWCPFEGALFSADFDFASHLGHVVRIDPLTGLGTVLGDPLLRDVRITGMAFDPVRRLLLAVTAGHGMRASELWTIDPATGGRDLVGPTGLPPTTLESLTWIPGDPPRLIAGGTQLYAVDTGTGAATPIGGNPNGKLWALATVPDCGPGEPDTDQDGVPDCLDGCPEDRDKVDPGGCGCGTPDADTDGDGTLDCDDLCPDDADKVAPGDCGCDVPDTDTDGDGTPDCDDLCPDDADKTAPGDCGCDVPDADTDGDGTPDCDDLCPGDAEKTAPGDCGCDVPDTDTDGDGTPDCDDLCPDDADKTAPGDCGCGEADDDTDGDGTADCDDLCPDDAQKTAPGDCGCGEADDDTDGDGTPDCDDLCPDDADKTAPGDCGCGEVDDDVDGDGLPDCSCPRGDVHPDGVGDGTVDLIDWTWGRRKVVLGTEEVNDHDRGCGDSGPANLACRPETGPARWCPDLDGSFTLDDLATIRGVAAGARALTCLPCLSGELGGGAELRLPGDVSPRALGGDGRVDVGDVVQVLRWVVRLDAEGNAEEFLRANVSGRELQDGVFVVVGDDRVDISDVVLILRAAVRLDTLLWPRRALALSLEGGPEFVAFRAWVDDWPPWAEVVAFTSATCEADPAAGLDALGTRCAITCASDPTSLQAPLLLVTSSYRGAEPVDPTSVTAAAVLVTPDLLLDEQPLMASTP